MVYMKKKTIVLLFNCLAVFLLFSCGSQQTKDNDGWTFIVLGDSRGSSSGINEEILVKLRKRIAREKPEFVLFSGDMIYGRSDYITVKQELLEWRKAFMEPLLKEGIRVYPVRGNHELVKGETDPLGSPWHDVFSGKYSLPSNGPLEEKNLTYSFKYRNALFLNLDSCVVRNRINQKWVDQQLSKNTSQHIFVQSHEPIYSMTGGHRDTLELYPAHRDDFASSLAEAGCKVYFCGHEHTYAHSFKDIEGRPLHQFIIGTAGAPLYDLDGVYRDRMVNSVNISNVYGFMSVEITESRVNIEMKSLEKDGSLKVIEFFSYTARPAKTSE